MNINERFYAHSLDHLESTAHRLHDAAFPKLGLPTPPPGHTGQALSTLVHSWQATVDHAAHNHAECARSFLGFLHVMRAEDEQLSHALDAVDAQEAGLNGGSGQ